VSRLGLPVVSLKTTLKKTITLLLFVSQCLLTPLASLHAKEKSTCTIATQVASAADDCSIKIGEYVLFLRALAAKESEAIYNTRFQDQIDRIWVGDHFDYQVREGTNENAPLKGALQEEVACYYDWIEYGADSQAAAPATDDKKVESSPLMMFRVGEKKSPNEKKSSSSEHLSPAERTDQERRRAEGMESIDAEGAQQVSDQTAGEQEDSKELPQLTLDAIRSALEQAPEASRFILSKDVHGNVRLVAQEADSTRPGAVRAENIDAIQAFKLVLQEAQVAEHSELDNLIPNNSMGTLKSYPALSATVIKNALALIAPIDNSSRAILSQFPLHEHMQAAIAAGEITLEDWKQVHPVILKPLLEKGTAAALAFDHLASAGDKSEKNRRIAQVKEKLEEYETVRKWALDPDQTKLDDISSIKNTIERAMKFVTSNIIASLNFNTLKDKAVFWR
jgi:hypothetical protein